MKTPFIIELEAIGEREKGFLTVVEKNGAIPFEVKRLYWLYDVPDLEERGNHAHLTTEQVLIPLHGAIRVKLENTKRRKFEFELHRPDQGLFIPTHYWHKIQFFDFAVVLTLSSTLYNPEDYVKDYAVFRSLKEGANG
jgi:hypothetical protein